MKRFDISIVADGQHIATATNSFFVTIIALLVAFPRKKYKDVCFTIKNSDNETEENENDV